MFVSDLEKLLQEHIKGLRMFTEMNLYFIHVYSNGLKYSERCTNLEDDTRSQWLSTSQNQWSQNFISCWLETVELSLN